MKQEADDAAANAAPKARWIDEDTEERTEEPTHRHDRTCDGSTSTVVLDQVSKTHVKRARQSSKVNLPEMVLISTPPTYKGKRLAKLEDMDKTYYYYDVQGRGQTVYALEFGYTANSVR